MWSLQTLLYVCMGCDQVTDFSFRVLGCIKDPSDLQRNMLKSNLLQIFQRVQWKAFANSSALLCTDTGE